MRFRTEREPVGGPAVRPSFLCVFCFISNFPFIRSHRGCPSVDVTFREWDPMTVLCFYFAGRSSLSETPARLACTASTHRALGHSVGREGSSFEEILRRECSVRFIVRRLHRSSRIAGPQRNIAALSACELLCARDSDREALSSYDARKRQKGQI